MMCFHITMYDVCKIKLLRNVLYYCLQAFNRDLHAIVMFDNFYFHLIAMPIDLLKYNVVKHCLIEMIAKGFLNLTLIHLF